MGATILDRILTRVRAEIEEDRAKRPIEEVKAMLCDAPEVRGFAEQIAGGFGIIAEIKVKSPSQGLMRKENVGEAPAAYENSPVVRAVSILTNRSDFGMSIELLRDIRASISKPVLRKEFIIDPYQVYEARAFGADAVLLMTQRSTTGELQHLHDLARELGMDVLVEAHTQEEMERFPRGVRLVGLNSRDMLAPAGRYVLSRVVKALVGGRADLSTAIRHFDRIDQLPNGALRVAESGISSASIRRIMELGYDAALVGSDLLLHRDGLSAALAEYEKAIGSTGSVPLL
ncbi:MAG: indole-3-glycerol phosphate synthase TrpC [Verrucomicrobia bacterium]|nr:indole-3-glycerol phosphate synthase TrpC [Verrucomicrobiota bacterium]MDA1088088.1 indole-3-glycerol phosphate synthase TrpC [Verrucomicrobiota bacterium]